MSGHGGFLYAPDLPQAILKWQSLTNSSVPRARFRKSDATRPGVPMASVRTRLIRAGRCGCLDYPGEAGGARLAVAAAKMASR